MSRRPEVRKVISSLAFAERLADLQSLFSRGLAEARRLVAFRDSFPGWIVDRKNEGAVRITFMANDPGTGFQPLVEALRAALPTDRFDCFYAGAVSGVVRLSEGLMGGIARGLATSLVVMAVVCVLLFRSVKLALIAFLPNAFPVVVVYGLMGIAGLPLNSGSAMVATITLGIALNDTVHLVLHYRERREGGDATDRALVETLGEIGRPVIMTSVVTCAGFAIFLLSDFRPLYHFGLLTGVAMVAALAGDLVMLPNLLKVFDRSAPGSQLGMQPRRSAPEVRRVPLDAR
jgi:predicted RND superfamily exporter protein